MIVMKRLASIIFLLPFTLNLEDHHKNYFMYGGDIGGGVTWVVPPINWGGNIAFRLEYIHYGKKILGYNAGGGLQYQPGGHFKAFAQYVNFQLFGGFVFLLKSYRKGSLNKVDIRTNLLYNPLIKSFDENFKIKTIGCGGLDLSVNFLLKNGMYLGGGIQLVDKLTNSSSFSWSKDHIFGRLIPRRYILFFKIGGYVDFDKSVDDFLLDEEIDFEVD